MSEFGGTIGRYFDTSTPSWPARPTPPPEAPNVVLVVLDDVGFAQLGCFGSNIETPVLDGLAAGGLRYRNFHTTSLCSPTRACLLTGRNHHSNGMGRIIELATGFPGYNAMIPRSNGMLPELLVPQGYAAYAVGKWHLTPDEECHLAAPRGRWPLGRGFERFYGFMGGETHQYAPALVHDNHFIEQPTRIRDGYHLTADLVDHSIEYLSDLRNVDPDKPFFLYLATGACHSPHQAPSDWIAQYEGRFDDGWDAWRDRTFARQLEAGVVAANTELSPRPPWVPAWGDLEPQHQRLYARYMEAFAGFLSHTDRQLGRLVDFLRATGDLDNTLLFVLSDNGASSEGGPTGSVNDVRVWNVAHTTRREAMARFDEIGGPRMHNNYPWGWTVAGNTPFRRWKREVHEGGVADPLIVHWPAGITARGEVRDQYVHAIDVLPTVLDVLGVDPPDSIDGAPQRPLEGVSFAASLSDADAASGHETQYYEMFGSRAIYHRGWKAVTYHEMYAGPDGFDRDAWELYDVTTDPSECHDLASEQPEKLRELVDLWWTEAERYQVLPLDDRPLSDIVLDRPTGLPSRRRYVYRSAGMVPEALAARLYNRSHTITATVEVGDRPAAGVVASQGNVLGGWVLFVQDGEVRYEHNYVALARHRISGPAPLEPGRHEIEFRFERTADHTGIGTLTVDGVTIGTGEIAPFTAVRFSLTGHGLTIGYSTEAPVSDDYEAPFAFSGRIESVVVTVEGDPAVDAAGEAAVAVITQ
ncbi:MAG: arylsulfatase [Frankiaceae bacterium]|nr:arylsulfatase [Frankiaceae bacterium]MBV9870417.1 arylsulfatase [Frankiaceae bacterium]